MDKEKLKIHIKIFESNILSAYNTPFLRCCHIIGEKCIIDAGEYVTMCHGRLAKYNQGDGFVLPIDYSIYENED